MGAAVCAAVSRKNLTGDRGCRGKGSRDRLTETSPQPRLGNAPRWQEEQGPWDCRGCWHLHPDGSYLISTGLVFQSRVG